MVRRRPELVFHLAAQADVRVSVARPAFDAEVNIVGSLHVLEGARQAETERVIFAASGGTLYGEPAPEDLPVREAHPHQPLSPYGVAKKSVLDYLVAYRELHALEFSALALANVYGPRQNPHGEAGVVAIFAQRLLAAEPVTIFGDGDQTRDFVYVDDVVDAFVRAATRGGGLICNIGTRQETSVNDLYRHHGRAGRAWTPLPVMAPLRPGELLRSSLDIERAAIQLGWRPWTPLATAPAPSSSSCASQLSWRPRRLPSDAASHQRKRSSSGGRTILGAPRPAAAMPPGTPRTMAAGTPRSLPMTSSAADASSSATHISVATSSRPLASGVPRRSTTAATPAQPMATSVTPRRHVRPKVSEMITPTSTPRSCRRAGPDTAGRAVRVLGEEGRRAYGHVGEVDASIGADEPVPGLADDEVTAAAEDADRLLLDQGGLGRRDRRGRWARSVPRPWTPPSG